MEQPHTRQAPHPARLAYTAPARAALLATRSGTLTMSIQIARKPPDAPALTAAAAAAAACRQPPAAQGVSLSLHFSMLAGCIYCTGAMQAQHMWAPQALAASRQTSTASPGERVAPPLRPSRPLHQVPAHPLAALLPVTAACLAAILMSDSHVFTCACSLGQLGSGAAPLPPACIDQPYPPQLCHCSQGEECTLDAILAALCSSATCKCSMLMVLWCDSCAIIKLAAARPLRARSPAACGGRTAALPLPQ